MSIKRIMVRDRLRRMLLKNRELCEINAMRYRRGFVHGDDGPNALPLGEC